MLNIEKIIDTKYNWREQNHSCKQKTSSWEKRKWLIIWYEYIDNSADQLHQAPFTCKEKKKSQSFFNLSTYNWWQRWQMFSILFLHFFLKIIKKIDSFAWTKFKFRKFYRQVFSTNVWFLSRLSSEVKTQKFY